MLRGCLTLCSRLWESPSAISAAFGAESSGSNTITGRLLLDLHTHVEHNELCVGRSHCYYTLPPCAQYILVPVAGWTWRRSQTWCSLHMGVHTYKHVTKLAKWILVNNVMKVIKLIMLNFLTNWFFCFLGQVTYNNMSYIKFKVLQKLWFYHNIRYKVIQINENKHICDEYLSLNLIVLLFYNHFCPSVTVQVSSYICFEFTRW